ncbi:MAG: hypothetical protein ACPG5B_11395 [Chitinophagales bacterium]
MDITINASDKQHIQKYFGSSLEELTYTDFQQKHKQLRVKYHPDNFAKFDDETIHEMATERFQSIEQLAEKLKAFFEEKQKVTIAEKESEETATVVQNRYAYDDLKFEIITRNKDLKYQLFGKFYRRLSWGDRYQIPNTAASLIIDNNHVGSSIGFNETIVFYLSFAASESVHDIAEWLYKNIVGQATSLLISKEWTPIDLLSIRRAIERKTILEITAGS